MISGCHMHHDDCHAQRAVLDQIDNGAVGDTLFQISTASGDQLLFFFF